MPMSIARASLCFALVLCVSACQPAASKSTAAPSPIVASGTGVTITAAELHERLSGEAEMTRGALRDEARKREYLSQIIDDEVLVAEARRQGLDQTPEFKATVRTMLIQRLWQARARAQQGPVEPAQQEAEQRQWVKSLREQAHVTIDEKALGAFEPTASH